MCSYNLSFSIDDQVVDVVRPKVGSDKALEAWMIRVLKKSMADYARELTTNREDRPSSLGLSRGEEEEGDSQLRAQATSAAEVDDSQLLSRLKALPNTPEGFLQLDTVLRPAKSSIDELREEAYAEKYGI